MKFFIIIVIFFFYQSCNLKQEDKGLDNSLNSIFSSNQFIKKNTSNLYETLQFKTDDPLTKVEAQNWLDKLEGLNDSTNLLIRKIESLNDYPTIEKDSEEIHIKLNNYINYIKGISSEIKGRNLIDTSLIKLIQSGYKNLINKSNLTYNKINIEVIKNAIYLTENNIFEFANNESSPGCILDFEKFSTIIAQNSSNFKYGEELKVTAGVGSFSLRSSPIFIVNSNSIVAPNESGVAIFKKKILDKKGKYKIPIVIKYLNEKGKKKSFESLIEYEVY